MLFLPCPPTSLDRGGKVKKSGFSLDVTYKLTVVDDKER